jgi:hypothetical protein
MPGEKAKQLSTAGAGSNFAPGTTWEAYTLGSGKAVSVYYANTRQKDPTYPQGYFCHGRTLGTHARYGYSVYGECVQTVLNDEYTSVLGLQLAKPGDVVLFSGKADETMHTCMIVNCATTPRMQTNVTVWTKNGHDIDRVCTLADVVLEYKPNKLSYWREKPEIAKLAGTGAPPGGAGTGGETKAPP